MRFSMNKPSIAALAFFGGLAASRAASPPPPTPTILGPSAVTWEQIEGAAGKGNSRPIFRAPTATLDELEMHVTHLPAGKEPHPPHKHPEEELVILKEGTLEALQDGKTKRLGPGSVLFQASNQVHGVRNVGDGPATYYVVRWASPGAHKASAPKP
jgi:quercetin dioxygenase-like cupin family protein